MQHPFAHRISLYVLGAALFLTAAFHLTLGQYFAGFAPITFFILALIAIHGLFLIADLKPNHWAYIFLPPMFAGLVATLLYANDQAWFLGILIATASFFLFAYWSANPLARWDLVTHLFPGRFWRETLFPFGVSESPTKYIAVNNRWKPILIGALISIPFLIIFVGLFASADLFFAHSIQNFTNLIDQDDIIPKLMRDALLGSMLASIGWLMWTRMRDIRSPIQKERLFHIDATMIVTVLAIINVLFLIFVAFQGVYFFAGHDYVQAQGLVYSEYMRQGFNQLLMAATFVFGGILIVHRLTRMIPKTVRVLSIALIIETFVILASAAKRLWLYVDAYHLTIDRYWGFVILGFIGLMLAWYVLNLIRQMTFSTQLKHTVVGALYFFAFVILFNQNSLIAKWNFAHQEGVIGLDRNYMIYELMPDATSIIYDSFAIYPDLWTTKASAYCDDQRCPTFRHSWEQRLNDLSRFGLNKHPFFLSVSEQKALQIAHDLFLTTQTSK